MKVKRNVMSFSLVMLFGCLLISCTKPRYHSSTLKDELNNATFVEIIEENLTKLPAGAQVAIGIIDQEDTEFIGVMNDQETLRSIENEERIFEIGSITKIFTSICLSDLVLSNEASLEETIQDQFDFSLHEGHDITLKQLANHTSGMPRLPSNLISWNDFDDQDPYASYDFDKFKGYLENKLKLKSESGTEYLYSNLATGMLGYILAQKRNSTYEELLQESVFKPLNMDQSTTLLDKVDMEKLVEPRNKKGKIVSHWNFSEITTGAGSIKSSVYDMEKFIRAHFKDDALYDLPQEETFVSEDEFSIGLGWFITERGDLRILSHDGGTGGFSSMLMIDKKSETAVIVLSNVQDFGKYTTALCNELFLTISE